METRWRQIYRKRRTDIDLVSFKTSPVNFLVVQLDQGTVFGETVGIDRDLDFLGVQHIANDALVRDATELGYLVAESVHLFDILRRLGYQRISSPPLPSSHAPGAFG